jgi:hypothetical protein
LRSACTKARPRSTVGAVHTRPHPRELDDTEGASRTGQQESPTMADGDRPRRRRQHRGILRSQHVGEPCKADGRGTGNSGLAGLGTRMPMMESRTAGRCRVITGKTRAVQGSMAWNDMTCAVVSAAPRPRGWFGGELGSRGRGPPLQLYTKVAERRGGREGMC